MKKLLSVFYLYISIFIISCSSVPENNNDNLASVTDKITSPIVKGQNPKAEIQSIPEKNRQKTKYIPNIQNHSLSNLTSNYAFMGAISGKRGNNPIRSRLPSPSIYNTEEYASITENSFLAVKNNPLSTFSIDVDTASYSNLRRFINQERLPPIDAIRIEELINYFNYDYPEPKGEHPFSIVTELSDTPWNPDSKLLHLGLKGKSIPKTDLPPSNLVLLLDVSGSMSARNKLPLLKSAFKLLVKQMGSKDRISIVVYASATGVVLPATSGDKKAAIIKSFEKLNAGGSTAGGAGINLAYKIAKENFIAEGNNRVILATDGDFNVGTSSTSELVRLIEKQRESGIYLTVLGVGGGNYKDSRMEELADKGNGNYAYLDNILEAKKVFLTEIGSTFFTIANDVKIQVEFNPAKIKAYKLIGYENRILKKEDFNDDTKDAGEIGADHTVTALYEIIPASSAIKLVEIDPLKYQKTRILQEAGKSNEIATVKFRYKQPGAKKSKLLIETVSENQLNFEHSSSNFRFSAAVAEYGLLMRNSKFKQKASFSHILSIARAAKGEDFHGYRAEFIQLVEKSQLLKGGQQK